MRTNRIVAIVAVGILLTGCSPSSTPSARPSGTGGSIASSAATDTPGPTPSATPPTPELPPTSEELIAAALESGAIGYEDSLVYRALALYDSPGLPDQFRSKVPDMHAATALLREIDQHVTELSTETLAKLAPYRVRPSDPTSIYSQPASASVTGGGQLAVVQAPLLAAAPSWKSKPAAGGKVRVWVLDSADADAVLTAHAADVETVWNAYPGIFTYPRPDRANVPSAAINPDAGIDIYFVNAGALDARRPECLSDPAALYCNLDNGNKGYSQTTEPYVSPRSSSGYVVVDAAGSGDDLLDTLAHELAHTAQFNYDDEEGDWLMESTATWVAYEVMRKLGKKPDFAYSWLGQFFGGLDKSLTRTDRFNAYASWPFFLYAAMEKGNGVVTDIWTAAGADGVEGAQAIDQVMPLDTYFGRFAVRNWNDDPVQPRYRDADPGFPFGYRPRPRNTVSSIKGGQQESLDASLPLLGSAYFQYAIEDSARAVDFDNTLAGLSGAHVWAIARIGDKWQPPEDWSAQQTKRFCRDAPEQDLTRLVLVVSNASPTDKLTPPDAPRLTGDAKGCVGWTGTMTGTHGWSNAGYQGTATGTFSGIWIYNDSGGYYCDAPDCLPFVASGSISWTWDAHVKGSAVVKSCDETNSGSLPAVDQFGLGDQQFLNLERTGDGRYAYWGAGAYYLSEAAKAGNKCYGLMGDGPINVPPPFFQIDQGSSASNPVGDGNTCFASDWVIDSKATTISGSCYQFQNSLNYLRFDWSLTRLGPPPGS
jgi:hypothetical protein